MGKITLAAHTFLYNGTKVPAYACAFADRSFVNDLGQSVLGGNDSTKMSGYVKRVGVTGAAGVWEIAAFSGANQLDSTVDTVTSQVRATYTLSVFTAAGSFITHIVTNMKLPDTPASTEWDDALAYSNAVSQPYRAQYYDVNQINRLLEDLVMGAVDWGDLGGAIADQTDLQAALNSKLSTSANTDAITEGAVNRYFTNARARLALSLTTSGSAGPAVYDPATGVLNVPQYGGGVGAGNTYKLSDYASLASALAGIGTTKAILEVDANVALTANAVIPATLMLRESGGVITKASTYTITFAGFGLTEPASKLPMFTGFSPGDITWSGVAPDVISSNLWSDAGLDDRLRNAFAAIPAGWYTVVAYPGDIPDFVAIPDSVSLHFAEGDFTFSTGSHQSTADAAGFIVGSNVRITGAGMGRSRLQESPDNVRFFYASGVDLYPYDGGNENIEITGLTFVGNPLTTTDPTSSAILLGNCRNGRVHHCSFIETSGYAAFCGGFSTANERADGVWITDNFMYGLKTQIIGAISGMNIHLSRNVIVMGPDAGSSLSAIDIEPNADSHGCDGVNIQDNIIDVRLSGRSVNAITAQSGFGDNLRHVKISGNMIIGRDHSSPVFRAADVNTATDEITLYAHGLRTGQAVQIYGVLPGGLGASPAYGFVIWVSGHIIKLASTQANALAGVAIDLTTAGTLGQVTSLGGLSNGIQLWGAQNSSVENNTIIGSTQRAVDGLQSFLSRIAENTFIGCATPLRMEGCVACEIDDNRVLRTGATVPLTQGSEVTEEDIALTVSTTSGSPIVNVTTGGGVLPWWWGGLTITIGGTDYVISYRGGVDTLVLTSNAGATLAGVVATLKASTNVYRGNNFAAYTLMPGSKVFSAADRDVSTSATIAQITANQNDFDPLSLARRWNLSTDASRNITGIRLDGGPNYYTQLDGQRHEIFNAGSFNIVLKDQDAGSTAAYRFKTDTGEDITLAPGQWAVIEYSTIVSRWLARKSGGGVDGGTP